MESNIGVKGRTFLGHPIGLYVLFLTQMWERFSYFGMLALLILYLNQYFKLSQDHASTIFKWYTSTIYFTPLVGAYLADRFLGNKLAVVIGAVLMALGHFLMAFSSLGILYTALILLVLGCGLLTPPLTTQVGLLYAPHDARRDSAYTIFYMGINLGAFLSPFFCGWLAENTRGRFHSGFTLAGIGMVVALITYLLGSRWIIEVEQGDNIAPDQNVAHSLASESSNFPRLTQTLPRLLFVIGIVLALASPVAAFLDQVTWDTVIVLELAAIAALMFGWILTAIRPAERDRVLAVLVLFVFATFYLVGSGQYGNAINLWADKNTNRYLLGEAPPLDVFPPAEDSEDPSSTDNEPRGFWERWSSMFERLPAKASGDGKNWGDWWREVWSPMPTAWFQSINPLLILLLAPFFGMLWISLQRRQLNPSIPTKMAIGLLLMALGFGVLWAGSQREAQETRITFASPLPKPLVVNSLGQLCRAEEGKDPIPYNAGRLFYDSGRHELRAIGVFSDPARDEIVADTAPTDFQQALSELQKRWSEKSGTEAFEGITVKLDRAPVGLDLRYAGLGKEQGNKKIQFDPESHELRITIELEEKEIKGLKVAAGDSALRSALDDLMRRSAAHRVSSWWLLGFFLLGTLGEMCLLPVGLSMVSQLAPARFATMLMGLWLLTFCFGNFLAGAFGEKWGTWDPPIFFLMLMAFVGAAALLLFAIGRKTASLMHSDS